jgi:hypothetical protein
VTSMTFRPDTPYMETHWLLTRDERATLLIALQECLQNPESAVHEALKLHDLSVLAISDKLSGRPARRTFLPESSRTPKLVKLDERERYLKRLEALTPAILAHVEANPGISMTNLRAKMQEDGCDEVALAFLGSTVLQLWDTGELEITTERGIIRRTPG